MMKRVRTILLTLFIGFTGFVFSQNNNCANATPFCTGQTMNFPATTGVPNSQPGPNYGCLGSQPNPAWFFMQMASSGSMAISMSAATDIDFICWGPFTNLASACGNLTQGNTQSCSYSPSNTETCTIANAIPGQFYVMLITNFSNQNQNITFNQSNQNNPGSSTTNCGFVCVVSGSISTAAICAGQSATVSMGAGTSTSVLTYTWMAPGGFTSTAGTNVFNNIQNTTTYTVVGTNSAVINAVPYTGTCQAVVTVSVLQYPTFSVSPTTTNICQGGNFFGSAVLPAGSNPTAYTYNWSPYSGAGVWQPAMQTTLISPILLPVGTPSATVVYSVRVSPASTIVSCPVTQTIAVTINNPLTPTLTPVLPMCDVSPTVQLMASPGGGTWSASPAVNPNGIFTPALVNPTITNVMVSYAVSVGTCNVSNSQTISVSRYNSPALTTSTLNTLCVLDPAFNLMNIVQNTVGGTWSGTQVNAQNYFNVTGLSTGTYALTYKRISSPNPTVCPSSTVLVVNVYNPPVPVINTIPPRCNTSGTFALSASPANVTWSIMPGISSLGIQNTSLNLIGTNTAIAIGGQGTCTASSSKIFNVSQYNTANITGTVAHLCVTSNPVGLMSIVQNTAGSWLSGPGVAPGSNKFDPANLATGIYDIVYFNPSTPDPTLCSDTRSITVSVLNPAHPSIAQVGPFCSADAPVQLTVTPATGYWVASSYLSSNGTFSPGISSVGSNGVQYVIGTNTCNAQQTIFISTEAFVQAAITSSLPDLCVTSSQIDLTPITANGSGNWSGTGISGTSFNPATSGAGKFTITYATTSQPSGLCPDRSTLSVNVFSLAIPSITQEGPFCNTAMPFKLKVSPVGGIFGSGVPGAVTSAGVFNPASTMAGDNVVSYSISSGPCVSNAQTHILIEEFVSADFAKYPANAYCVNSTAFNLNSLAQNPGGDWMINGNLISGSMFDPFQSLIGDNYVTHMTYSSATRKALCPDSKSILIKVRDIPKVSAVSNKYSGCAPVEVVLTSSVVGIGKGSWHFDDGSDEQKGLSVSHIYTTPGTYTVMFSYEDSEAKTCAAQYALKEITVNENPKADFIVYPEEFTIDNPDALFTNTSSSVKNNKYVWSISGLDQTYDINRQVSFPQIGTYKITLVATTAEDCKDEVSKTVEVKNNFNVFIPNTFTPNYDGMNDDFKPVFSPYGLDTKNYSLEIFDRWGHLVFSTSEYTKGWNGTNKSDEAAKEDTYIYKLRYKDLNGQLYNKDGSVILLK